MSDSINGDAGSEALRLRPLDPRSLDQAWIRERSRAARTGSPIAALLVQPSTPDHPADPAEPPEPPETVLRCLFQRRPTDVAATMRGGCYLLLLPDTEARGALRMAERVRRSVAAAGPQPLVWSVAIGAGALDPSVHDLSVCLQPVAQAMRDAARGGGNRVCRVRAGEDRSRRDRPGIAGQPHWVVRQPIVAVQDRSTQGWEYLARSMDSPDRAPALLRQHRLEATEELVRLDRRCFDTAVHRVSAAPPLERVHLNLVPRTITSSTARWLVDRCSPAARRSPMCIELDARRVGACLPALVPHLDQLRAGGVQLGIDHVGSEGVGLEAVAELAPDVVKLSPQVVNDLLAGGRRHSRAARLVAMLLASGAEIVALGVESQAHLDALARVGIGLAQGFALGRPAA